MRIGGFQKTSLIDWEGRIVSVIFTKGCNFRCGYCHNPSLVIPDLMKKTQDIKEEIVFSYLKSRVKWLDGIVISGGEPTIHKDLPEFLHKIRQIGLPVKLDTNGTNPQLIKSLIKDRLIDSISMDIKTIMTLNEYSKVTNCDNQDYPDRVNESVRIIRMSEIQFQFRTTVLPKFHSADILSTLENTFRSDPYNLQTFRSGFTIDEYNSLRHNKYRNQVVQVGLNS